MSTHKHLTAGIEQDLQQQLQSIDTRFLLAIHYGGVDVQSVARRELAARGIGSNGRWVGFAEASQDLGL